MKFKGIDAEAAFAGFSNPAPITVALLYIVAEAVSQTGVLQPLVSGALSRRGERTGLIRILAPVAGASSVLNNTPIVAMLVPEIRSWSSRNGRAPSRLRGVLLASAFVDAPQGTLIAYATAPGSVADDGRAGHGPYTESLIRHLRTPAVPIESVFKAVRRDVQATTDGRQTPWESSSLTGDFFFVPRARSKR